MLKDVFLAGGVRTPIGGFSGSLSTVSAPVLGSHVARGVLERAGLWTVGNDVIDIQEALTGHSYDREALFDAMVTAFEGDPAHKCMGRSAPARLKRALEHAAAHGLETPALKRIAQQTGND